jgi:hypothetical protein
VIQFVVPGLVPKFPILRARCISDPEVLLDISRQLELPGSHGCEQANRFSLILHDVRVGGTWKRTNRGRLRSTEEMLCAHIAPALRNGLIFLDVGASDGITTIDALRVLRRAFGECVTALLADINLSLLRYRWGPIVEYRGGDGEVVMVRLGRVGVRLARQRHREQANNWFNQQYLRMKRLRRSMRAEAPISLVHPLARRESGIAVIKLDCLTRAACLKGRFGAIRASNVLNLDYFDSAQLYKAVGNLHLYMHDGGCLVVSRNQDERSRELENGSVWVKDGGRFRWVADFGDASEIKLIVDRWPSR